MLMSIFVSLRRFMRVSENDEAFRLLEKGYAERSAGMPFLAVDPFWSGLRSDPHYADLLRPWG
jgi:hypothetical protein